MIFKNEIWGIQNFNKKILEICISLAVRMAQWVKALPARPDGLSHHVLEGENGFLNIVLQLACVHTDCTALNINTT